MAGRERAVWLIVSLALALALALLVKHTERASPAPEVDRPRPTPGAPISMAALHQQGGVPLGWELTLAPGNPVAGRAAFDRLGCAACHRVAGESFKSGVAEPPGPELTGMGNHHPPAYFAEAILNPDAVIVDGPGFVGQDGHSTMPAYPDLTIGELSDLVAYLASLRDVGSTSAHPAGSLPGVGAIDPLALTRRDRPAPGAGEARVFFAQSYDVLPGKLDAFERWFRATGRAGFLAAEGLVSLDTFVDAARPSSALTTVFGFRDEAALRTFLGDPAMADLWKEFDAYVGPHGHIAADGPLVYRVPALSADEAAPRP